MAEDGTILPSGGHAPFLIERNRMLNDFNQCGDGNIDIRRRFWLL